jgi:AAA+ ATPase superfamily predicted ATPase
MFLFINRRKELEFLDQKFKQPDAQMVVLYGRRRTGKTELIKQFCKDKEFIYFLADKRGTVLNTSRFTSIAVDHFNDIPPKIEDFYLLFEYIKRRLDPAKKMVLIIDEFSYLVEKDDSIPSVFQGIWDEVLMNENVFLILCGSSISMMEHGVLSYKSPLYGRRTGQWKMSAFSFKDMREFFPDFLMTERAEIYGVLGGIPLYLKQFKKRNLFSNIEEKIMTKGELLYEEVEFLLREELREYSSYYSILEAIASGRTRIIEIADHSRIKAGDLPKYLDILIKLDIIEKVHPVTEKEKTKKTIYRIRDNFFNFWFKFVFPHKSDIEMGNSQKVMDIIKQDFSSYMGHIFEDIVKEFMIELNTKNLLPLNFMKIGTWWSKEKEIDLVALSKNEALFVECKWQSRKTDIDVLQNLIDTAQFVKWQREKDYYAVVSRSGFTLRAEDYAREKGILLFGEIELRNVFNS